jgi:hypothetical protein
MSTCHNLSHGIELNRDLQCERTASRRRRDASPRIEFARSVAQFVVASVAVIIPGSIAPAVVLRIPPAPAATQSVPKVGRAAAMRELTSAKARSVIIAEEAVAAETSTTTTGECAAHFIMTEARPPVRTALKREVGRSAKRPAAVTFRERPGSTPERCVKSPTITVRPAVAIEHETARSATKPRAAPAVTVVVAIAGIAAPGNWRPVAPERRPEARSVIPAPISVARPEGRKGPANAARPIPIIVVITFPIEPRTAPWAVVVPLAAVIVAEPVRSAARAFAGLSPGGIGQHCSNERAW